MSSKKVIIYQMGKVASTSIRKSLKLVEGIDVFHSHHLSPSYTEELNNIKKKLGWKWDITITPDSINELRSKIFIEDEIFVITLVREPIGRNISSYFQNIDKIVSSKGSFQNLSIQEIKDSFLNQFPHYEPITWFENEFNSVLGINIYDYPFPKDKGAHLFKEGKFNILVMHYDLDDLEKQILIEKLLDIKNFHIISENIGSKKRYSKIYKKFINEVTFSEEFINDLLETKYTLHFFSKSKIEHLKHKWTTKFVDSIQDEINYFDKKELKKGKNMKKVHVGSGQHYLPGYINIEYTPNLPFKVDMMSSGMELPFKENSIDEIISFHVIEHMPRPQKSKDNKWRKNVDDFLEECSRVLKEGGTFIAECPDLEKILSEIVNDSNWTMIDHIFGLDRYKGDTHQWGYTRKSLKELLAKHGFRNIKISDGTDYHSLSEPSLRVEATKIGLKRINIEPTSACNLECLICSRDELKRPNKNMDFDLYRTIIDQLFNLGLLDIEIRYFLSGEPLIAGKALVRMIKYAKKIGFTNTLIHTNGTLLNKYGEGILKAGIDVVSISFDGAEKNEYEKIRLNSNFEKAVERVNTFLQWAKEYPTKTIVQTIIETDKNKDEYKSLMMNLLPGADEYKIRYPHNWNSIDSITGQSTFTKKVTKCFPSENLSIYADGKVPICCADLNGDFILADVTKEPLLDIWVNQLGDIRDRMAIGAPIPELCDSCERYSNKSIENNEEDILREAEQFIAEGKLEEAELLLNEILKQNPNSIESITNLGVIETIKEQYLEAISYFEQALNIDNTNELVVENINYVREQLTNEKQMVKE